MELWESMVRCGFALVAGLAMGVVYFGGLWWTVRRMPTVRHPWALYGASLVGRIMLTLTVIYVILEQLGVLALLTMLAAFFLVRVRMISRLEGDAAWGPSAEGTTR